MFLMVYCLNIYVICDKYNLFYRICEIIVNKNVFVNKNYICINIVREFGTTGMSHLSVFASRWQVAIALTATCSSAEKRNPVEKAKTAYPYVRFLDSAFQRNDDLTLSCRKAKRQEIL